MKKNFNLNFISQKDFEEHVLNTIKEYKDTLKKVDLKKFNSNIIDPIKLLFDKNVFDITYEEIIKREIHRQRDKSNNNYIGYFHQNIFKYIKNCEVPKTGWDIIVKKDNKIFEKDTVFEELKNLDANILKALYKLAFKTYEGFENF